MGKGTRAILGASLLFAACSAAVPEPAQAVAAVAAPPPSPPPASTSSASAPLSAPPPAPAIDGVTLAGESPTDCYCMDALATPDVRNSSLRWATGASASLGTQQLLLVTALASYRCAIPGFVGTPAFDRARPRGADVVVDLSWRGFADRAVVPHGAVIPAPGPGGRVLVELHDSWMGGQPSRVERCVVTIAGAP